MYALILKLKIGKIKTSEKYNIPRFLVKFETLPLGNWSRG